MNIGCKEKGSLHLSAPFPTDILSSFLLIGHPSFLIRFLFGASPHLSHSIATPTSLYMMFPLLTMLFLPIFCIDRSHSSLASSQDILFPQNLPWLASSTWSYSQSLLRPIHVVPGLNASDSGQFNSTNCTECLLCVSHILLGTWDMSKEIAK